MSDSQLDKINRDREEFLKRKEAIDWFNSLPEQEQKRIREVNRKRMQKLSEKEAQQEFFLATINSSNGLITEALEMDECYKKYHFLFNGLRLGTIIHGRYEKHKDWINEITRKCIKYERLEMEIERHSFLFSIDKYNEKLKLKDILFEKIKKNVLDLFYTECEVKANER